MSRGETSGVGGRSGEAIKAFLARSSLFGATSEATRALVAAHLSPVRFCADQTIFSRGEPGKELYLVVRGRVRLLVTTENGRELSFLHAGPGVVFGEIAALDGGPRTADAHAATDIEAMMLARPQIERLFIAAPDFAQQAVQFLCARLRATDDLLISIGLHSIEVRLARLVLYTAKRQGHDASARRIEIEFPYSQSELAALVGASRPKVSLAMSALESAGAFTRGTGRLVCDMARLSASAIEGG